MVTYGNPYYRSMETLLEMYGFSIAFSLSWEGGGDNLSNWTIRAANQKPQIFPLKFCGSDWLLLKNVKFLDVIDYKTYKELRYIMIK